MERFTYVLKPITREQTFRNQKNMKKKANKISFKEQRVESNSFVLSSPTKGESLIPDINRKYSNLPIISEIQKNKMTELISSIKSLTLGLNSRLINVLDSFKQNLPLDSKEPFLFNKLNKLWDVQDDLK